MDEKLSAYELDAVTLCAFLERGDAESVRLRVARNLCVAVRSAKIKGLCLGRLHPDRILVKPASCRVMLVVESGGVLADAAHPDYVSESAGDAAVVEEPYDLFFHAYALMRGTAGVKLEQAVWPKFEGWNARYPEVTQASMSSAILLSAKRPMIIRLLDRVVGGDTFSGPFWDQPAWKRTLLEKYVPPATAGVLATSLGFSSLARELFVGIGFGARPVLGKQDRFSRLKALLSGGGVLREDAKRNERRALGVKGYGHPNVFWLGTLATSMLLGTCSALYGYSPVDAVLYPMDSLMLSGEAAVRLLLYPVAAIVGCVFYNVLFTRRGNFSGYTKLDYFCSVAFCVVFMALGRFALAYIGALL